MKNGFITFVMACAISIAFAVDQGNLEKRKPSVTLSPAESFDNHSDTPSPGNTTTATPPPHTNATTTTATPPPHTNATTTTVPHPQTTNSTTAHTTARHPTVAPTTHNATTAPANHTTAPANHTTAPANHTSAPSPTPPVPSPTPKANLTLGNYNVSNAQGIQCVLVQMALQIKVDYKTNAGNKTLGTFIVQPSMSKATGGCSDTVARFNLSFPEGYVALSFLKNATQKAVYVTNIDVKVTYPFANAVGNQYQATNNSVQLFSAAVGHSYSCRSQSVYMGNGITLDMTQNKLQAFNFTSTKGFGQPDNCPADKPDYRVAIAVGIVLLILIIIVVLAYLVGRRRRTDGYQSL